jgi:hypothetical protein
MHNSKYSLEEYSNLEDNTMFLEFTNIVIIFLASDMIILFSELQNILRIGDRFQK